uniref:RING finger protein 126 n=1 Tax=Anthurium amnicola TaxID=1678845 RepID=A0A1D1XGP2_9ARAE
MEGRWVHIIQRVSYLSGYFTGWQITGILCLLLISVLLVLGSYALLIYLLELYWAQQTQAAAARSFKARQDSVAPMVATFRTVCYGPAKGEYSEEEQCPVCLDDYEVGQELSRAPCGHAFHYQCLVDHMATPENPRQKLPTCPLCRAELTCMRYVDSTEI